MVPMVTIPVFLGVGGAGKVLLPEGLALRPDGVHHPLPSRLTLGLAIDFEAQLGKLTAESEDSS